MHQMRLTNRQIQELVSDIRRQLKSIKVIDGTFDLSYKVPEQKDAEKAKLIFTQTAWNKMTALVDTCDKEIAWHGLVEKNENEYTITDIIVFPQTVSAATVTSDETEYSLWVAQQPDEIFNSMRFHGHSHVNMGVSPSGVDTEYQNNMLKNLNDFYIFAIFNKKGDHWCAIYDVESNMAYGNSDVEVIAPNTEEAEWAKEQIKQFIKNPAPVPAATIASKYPINKHKKKADKPKEKSNTPYTDSFMYDEDEDGYVYGNYYGYPWQGGYYGQK